MPNYRATNRDTKEVVLYTESSPRPEHLVAPWRIEEMVISYPSADPPPVNTTVYGGRRVLSRREFLGLFTQTERIQIRAFAKGNSQQAQALDDYVFMLSLADTVDLDNQDVIDGLTMLEAGGILAAGRKETIRKG